MTLTLSSGICIGAVAIALYCALGWYLVARERDHARGRLRVALAELAAANDAVRMAQGRANNHASARAMLRAHVDDLRPLAAIGRARKAALDRASAKKREARK